MKLLEFIDSAGSYCPQHLPETLTAEHQPEVYLMGIVTSSQ